MRPWEGIVETPAVESRPRYDAACRLCPGNERTSGIRNPNYRGTFVFDNDFPALMPSERDAREGQDEADVLFRAHPAPGRCRVFCLSPGHDLSMGLMALSDIVPVVDMWVDEYRALGVQREINHVQIFENRGAMMGCSNPHPHGQIWADATVPDLVQAEAAHQVGYFTAHGRTLLSDYIARELEYGERIVFTNDSFVAVVPYWAAWPYETLIAPRLPLADLTELSAAQRIDFAAALHEMNVRFDLVFNAPFPYTMGIHQKPTDGLRHPHWHFHVHYYPPLLRSAQVRKFMAGYEMLAMSQRDMTPEQAAKRLRSTQVQTASV